MRYVKPVPVREARGLVARVYAQVQRDFGVVGPPMAFHSPLPELLAGAWSSLREIVLVGSVPRERKELVAAAISRANECPFCVDAHTLMLSAAGDGATARALHRADGWPRDPVLRRYAEWGEATRRRGDPVLEDPPFGPADAPEMLGTVACFQYINRLMTAVGEESPFPWPVRGFLKTPMLWLAGRMFRRVFRASRRAGESFDLVAPGELPPAMAWTRPDDRVTGALARWWRGVKGSAEEHLPAAVVAWSRDHIGAWDGADPPLGRAWLEEAGALGDDGPVARLVLLVALAPHRLTDADVDAFRHRLPGDAALVAALAWGAGLASMRICRWCAEPEGDGPGTAPAASGSG